MSTALHILGAISVTAISVFLLFQVWVDHCNRRRRRREEQKILRGLEDWHRRGRPLMTITDRDHPLAVIGSIRRGPGEGPQ